MSEKITIYTRVYNTEKYLKKCLDSVINQSYKNFQHIIIDNGCTDGCTEILKNYAEKYSWVKLIRYEKNRSDIDITDMIDTEYYCQLDTDDWLEPTFLERMIELITSENADIVATGSAFCDENESVLRYRKSNNFLSIEGKHFADNYTIYHQFFRTTWAKLYKLSVYKDVVKKIIELKIQNNLKLTYGSDTVQAFMAIRNSKKIVIDDSVLHNYRLHQSSSSYEYNSDRFDSDVFLYNDALDFLSHYGEISDKNQEFVDVVYINAINDTINVISNSNLSYKQKLEEYLKILNHSITIKIYKKYNDDAVKNNKFLFFHESVQCIIQIKDPIASAKFLYDIVCAISPDCCSIVNLKVLSLIPTTIFTDFIVALVNNDKNVLYKYILQTIKNTKNDYLFQLIKKEAQNDLLLCNIKNINFVIDYCNVYYMILTSNYKDALDLMTKYISDNRRITELFLIIYSSLAAMMNSVDEFIYGKINLSKYYYMTKNKEKCIEIISELSDMGISDNKEIIKIKKELEI